MVSDHSDVSSEAANNGWLMTSLSGLYMMLNTSHNSIQEDIDNDNK